MRTVITKFKPPEWDEWVDQLTKDQFAFHHRQVWAERFKTVRGYEPLYIFITENESPLAVILAFEIKPWKLKNIREIAYYILQGIKTGSFKSLSWYALPLTGSEYRDRIYEELSHAIEQYSKDNKIKISGGHWPADIHPHENWQSKKWATLTIDCRLNDEELMSSFKSSARKAIRKATSDGIKIRRIETLDQMREYYRFAEKCSKRYGKKLSGFDDFGNLFTEVREKAIFETFIAEKEGETLAGLSVWGDGIYIQELGSFNSEKAFREKLYGSDLIKWEIIRWARGKGIKYFDLAGINPSPANKKEQSIRRFKEKWGGRYSEYLLVSSR